MSTPDKDSSSKQTDPGLPVGVWITRCQIFQLADGSYLLKPKRPKLRASARETAKATGVSCKTLARLAESGFIRCARITDRLPMYYPAEVEAFIRQTEQDPDYWTKDRKKQYGLGRERRK